MGSQYIANKEPIVEPIESQHKRIASIESQHSNTDPAQSQ
jgi:hypothetical protein